jgi:CheY-like chemotaxis protein
MSELAVSTPGPTAEAVIVPTILLVDADRVSCKYFEVSLVRSGKYNLEIAGNIAAAMEILATGVVDLIITDLYMPDGDGFRFINRLQREQRLRGIPVVIVSSETSIASKVSGFQLGIHDYLTKPVQMQDLTARLDAILARSARRRDALRSKRYSLAGDFSGISFCDLINLLSFGQRSGTLSILTPRAAGKLWFAGGELHDLTFGNLEGVPAFNMLMRQETGQFEFAPMRSDDPPHERKIFQSAMGLMMDGARLLDEANSSSDRAPKTEENPIARGARADVAAPRAPSMPPKHLFVSALQESLSGAFTLGELAFRSQDELAEWTSAAGSGKRFHVVLVAEAADGVSALVALAAPLSEYQVALALTGRGLSLSLNFDLPNALSADLVLVDQRAPAATLDSLRLSPCVLIVAPPRGDWLSLGVEQSVGMATLIQTLHPRCVFGIGAPGLEDSLREMIGASGAETPLQCLQGSLSEDGFDFRDALLAALKFWGETGA